MASHHARPQLRILIADDHALVRRGIRDIISNTDDMRVVGEASDGQQAVELATRLRPLGLGLVLIDMDMPKLSGIEATRRITAADPSLPVVMIATSMTESDVVAAVRAGAVGFLHKNLSPSALVRALRDFHRGGALPMSRTMAASTLSHFRSAALGQEAGTPETTEGRHTSQPLTPREQDVLRLIAHGARDRDIAEQLCVSENTVKKHVKNILQKLGVRNRAQATAVHLAQDGHQPTR